MKTVDFQDIINGSHRFIQLVWIILEWYLCPQTITVFPPHMTAASVLKSVIWVLGRWPSGYTR